jgi:hypothetical protein
MTDQRVGYVRHDSQPSPAQDLRFPSFRAYDRHED